MQEPAPARRPGDNANNVGEKKRPKCTWKYDLKVGILKLVSNTENLCKDFTVAINHKRHFAASLAGWGAL
jgi:hypothetical protein